MDVFGILFTILTIVFVVIPVVGIVLLIRYVIKKSKADQPKHILEKEKNELLTKARSKKSKLIDWRRDDLENLSNDLDFNYSKGFTMRFNGTINSLNGERLIAFRRLDRGNFNTTSKIVAISKSFEIYFSQKQNEVAIYFDSKYLGKLINDDIIDHNQETIGKLNRNRSNKDYYIIELNQEQIAFVIKNSERRTLLRNPFFDFRPSNALEVEPFDENPVSISNTLRLYRELNDYEYHWILSLAIYEIIYYGIDFTQ
ncbi:hypothetical protein [Winogradskyella sp.]|uniref:hypothetical protein n=1 Tax=Winogradskyella sp. TaxID=1883156 RepID=UPI003BA8F967